MGDNFETKLNKSLVFEIALFAVILIALGLVFSYNMRPVNFEENVTVYRGAETTIEPIFKSGKIASSRTYFDYDRNILQVDNDKSTILPVKVGTSNISVKVGWIERSATITVLPSVEQISVNKPETTIVEGNWSYVIMSYEPLNAANNVFIWSSSDESIATCEDGMIKSKKIGECTVTVSTVEAPFVSCEIQVKVIDPSEAPNQYERGVYGYPEIIIEGPYYIDGILIVNKQYSLPANFAPGVDAVAYEALKKLQADAKAHGYKLPKKSTYRPYGYQTKLYTWYLIDKGVDWTNRSSARPGHSEHQTGLAFDIGYLVQSWGDTADAKWLAANAHKYGFIIRYPKDKTDITKYKYEPWHVRYLGVETATKVYESGLTLEEYLGIAQ